MTTGITSLELRNFKCFRRQPLEFGGLSVLTGLNGMGKSSVIQALLLLRQSFASGSARRLRLGGELVDLGTGTDVFYDLADEDEISFVLELNDEHRIEYNFKYDRRADSLESVADRRGAAQYTHQKTIDGLWKPLSSEHVLRRPSHNPLMSFRSFQYLAAERLGPRKMLPWSEEEIRKRSLGVQGEHVLAYLSRYGSEGLPLDDPRLFAGEVKATIEGQVTAWLQEASPGSLLDIAELRAVDALSARYSFQRKGDVASKPFRATNVGFGLSYVLPVITALIAAKEGDLVIIENPEAHLHPRGQTKLGELAAKATQAGVQIIVETHSDHFLDGVRVSVREKIVGRESVRIHYFTRHGSEAAVISPEMNQDGSLSEWPQGFFDERDQNLLRLLNPIS